MSINICWYFWQCRR